VELLLSWLRELAKRRPTLFVVEDLHWVDPTTLDLISDHVEHYESGRLLTILTFRPEFQTPWRSFPHQTQIALNRLTKRQIGDMMKRRSGRHDIPDTVVQQVAARTDGVPLFIEEFTALIIESGVLDGSASGDLLRSLIPATLQDLLVTRLDRMASNPDVVQLAATIGREFSYPLLAAVCDLPESELQTELDKLVRAELLFRKGRVPKAQYMFKHALIQDSAYRLLLKKRRQQFHWKIATALESRFPDVKETQPGLLAHHFTEADQTELALGYWLKAGQRSQARSAVEEAIAAFQRGLQLVATLPDGAGRDVWELQFQMPFGAVQVQRRGYGAPEPGAAFSRARQLCEKLGQQQMLGFVLAGLWGWHLVRAEFEDCLKLANDMVRLSEQVNDVSMTIEASWAMTCTLFYLGRFMESTVHCRRGVELYDQQPACTRPFMAVTGQNAGVTLRGYGALSLFCLGERDAALAMSQDAIDLARRTNDPFSLSMALYHGGWLRVWCGQADAVKKIADEGVALCRQLSFVFYESLDLINLAVVPLMDRATPPRQLDASITGVRQAIAAYMATGGRVHLPHPHSLLADALRRLGRLDEAQAEIDTAFAAQSRSGERFLDADLHRLQAEIHTSRGDRAAAQASLAKALEIAEGQKALAWIRRAQEARSRFLPVGSPSQHGT
jgi:tetratricopeptide (TPR) repeat protein